MSTNQSIESLYKSYLANELNGEDLADFLQRLNDPANEAIVSQLMEGTWNEMYEVKEAAPVISIRRRPWIKYVAAACIILLVGIATYTVISNRWAAKPGTIGEKSPAVADVPAPSNTRAVITLADGSKVYLDSAGNGTIAQENNVNVVKNAEGAIVYQAGKVSPVGGDLEGAYNTLYNPRGSKVISLTLSDGTRVWLNAESSLRYPASFASAAVREVEITGEAYFEVAHVSTPGASATPASGGQSRNGKAGLLPFIVKKGDVSVTVLGTHFNVNAYDDEEAIKVTLLEGSVKVTQLSGKVSPVGGDLEGARRGVNNSVTIKPGEQAVATPNTKLQTLNNIDINQVMAWKDGLFKFDKTDIQTVMRQISRWYDVAVSYPDGIPKDEYWGAIRRDQNLSTVFKVLEASGAHFKIEGKKVIVLK